MFSRCFGFYRTKVLPAVHKVNELVQDFQDLGEACRTT